MKKYLFLLSFLILFPLQAFAQTSTVSKLPELTVPNDSDLLYIVRPGDAQPDRKITVDNLRDSMQIGISGDSGVTDGDKGDIIVSATGTVYTVESVTSGLAFLGDVTPTQIVADADNYTGCVVASNTICRLSTDASRNLTGITGGTDGRYLEIFNVGAFNIVLVNDSTSTAANRFLIGGNITIGANQGIILRYDPTSLRWRAASGISGAGAPTNATYITSTSDGTLSNEFALGSLATGILRNITTTGIPEIATEGTHYWAPGGTDVAVADGGTGASNASGARTNLAAAGLADTNVFTAKNSFGHALAVTSDISPAQITADVNDYAGCAVGTNAVCRIDTDAPRNITGLAAGADGLLVFIYNVGASTATLVNQSVSSAVGNRFAIASHITIGSNQGIIVQYDPISARWRQASGISGAGGQAADDDLSAIAALSGTGFLAHTGTNTWAERTLTGASGNISISSNPSGVAGNPVIDLGTTAVQTDQTNVYGAFLQDFGAGTMELPNAAGGNPGTNQIIIDTTSDTLIVNIDGTDKTVATIDGNIATTTAFAANPVGCDKTAGQFTYDINASGTSDCDTPIRAQDAAPSVNSCLYKGQIHHDGRSFSAGVQGYTYVCYDIGGTPATLLSQIDGVTTFSDGAATFSPSGPDTAVWRGSGGVVYDAYSKSTATFTNQPTNDGWEAVSTDANDTGANGKFLRVCATLTGGDDKTLTCETIGLNGTTFISSVTTTYADIHTVRLCTTAACVANATAAGTVTLREASGNATIITLAPGVSKAATQDTMLTGITSTLDINSLTQETTINSANDKFPFYDASAGANREGRTTDIISTWEVTFKAVSCDVTTGTLILDTVNSSKPTADCTAGSTESTMIRGVALFPDSDGAFSVQDWFELPATWTGAIDARITWRANATANDVAWKLQTACRTTGEVDDVAWNAEQEIVDTALGTANFLNHASQASVTTTGCAAGEIFRWKLSRDRTDAQDTLAVAPGLFSIKFTGRKKLGT